MQLLKLPLCGMINGNADIAAHLREMANWVEAPDAVPLRSIVMVIETEEGDLKRRSVGKPMEIARAIGLLMMCAAQGACIDEDD